MLKNVAFDSLATALAWKKEKRFQNQSRVYLATRLTIHDIIKFIIQNEQKNPMNDVSVTDIRVQTVFVYYMYKRTQ